MQGVRADLKGDRIQGQSILPLSDSHSGITELRMCKVRGELLGTHSTQRMGLGFKRPDA